MNIVTNGLTHVGIEDVSYGEAGYHSNVKHIGITDRRLDHNICRGTVTSDSRADPISRDQGRTR